MKFNHIFLCGRPEHPPNVDPNRKNPQSKHPGKGVLSRRVAGKGFFVAYRMCRRAGLPPWCSARLALQYAL